MQRKSCSVNPVRDHNTSQPSSVLSLLFESSVRRRHPLDARYDLRLSPTWNYLIQLFSSLNAGCQHCHFIWTTALILVGVHLRHYLRRSRVFVSGDIPNTRGLAHEIQGARTRICQYLLRCSGYEVLFICLARGVSLVASGCCLIHVDLIVDV